MESRRQQKVGNVLLKDLGEIFQRESRNLFNGAFITVTVVRVTPDLSYAKVYLSVLGKDGEKVIEDIRKKGNEVKFLLAKRVKNQMRKVPDLAFYLDDSLDYYDKINDLLTNK